MTPDQEAILATLALVLTSAGAVIGAALVSAGVQFLKSIPVVPTDGRERLWAFVLSGILVWTAYLSVTVFAQPSAALSFLGLIGALFAWYNVARLSMAVYADVTAEPNSLTGRNV